MADRHQLELAFDDVRSAALDQGRISGLTHAFYRYPARFAPAFARACIEAFSRPGDVVLDPYMGGGTTVVEAMASGRRSVGSDINSLAVFVTRAKVTRLSAYERASLSRWAAEAVPELRCTDRLDSGDPELAHRPRNMAIPSVRWHRRLIAACLASIKDELPTADSKRFARCVLLNVGQWALNGRKSTPTVAQFRSRVSETCDEMLRGSEELGRVLSASASTVHQPIIRQICAEDLSQDVGLHSMPPADLVVTSPPYPGIHMLYHRWQVDGRKETDAPYWIAACNDGDGATHYNFAGRHRQAEDRYFEKAHDAFSAIRRAARDGAVMVQMIAFSNPARQFSRYLSTMQRAGFSELRPDGRRRIWRRVPGRRWHAHLQGQTSSSREVVLIHIAD